MKRYAYQVLSLRNEIQKVRDSVNPHKDLGDEVLMIDILNGFGMAGWKVLNPWNNLEVYMEKEIDDKP